ncbi:Mu transposase C-terminal domain-containing protein [Bacillus sp. E214]|uniref:Mu transposase C-terminal domain-containing protein n=1 Tax=Bacillus sp. E214 TaxID=2587156 RepID=UPI0011DF4B92|nr:Mu transposase C-terminal domain-containing protein [Bacillus sp. E214]
MRTRFLKIGDEFTYYDIKHVVFDIDISGVSIQRLDGGNKVHKVNYHTLVTDSSFRLVGEIQKELKKETERTIVSQLDCLTPEKRDKVSSKYEMIAPILLHENIKDGDLVSNYAFKERYAYLLFDDESPLSISKEKLIDRISKEYNKSTRQIKRYLAAYKNAEDNFPNHGLEGLMDKHSIVRIVRTDERAINICHPKYPEKVLGVIYSRLGIEYDEIIKEAIEKHYLKKRKITIANLHEQIEIMCHSKGIKSIGYDTVYNIIANRLDDKIKDIYRKGNIEDYLEHSRGFANQFAKAPLHIVEVDHTKLDIDIIDENSGANLGRPWVTMGIDVYTRMIWCMHISFEDPSADKVRKAIQHGIFFKKIKEKYNTVNEWEISGIPKIIYFDNGTEFKNTSIKRMVEETLQSQVMYRPVATPRYGGVIERFFGTINKNFIHKLAGTRKSNTVELGEYDAESEAIFTLDDIIELLTAYIVDVYHHSIQRGLPHDYPTPTARFYQGIDTLGYPEFISQEDEAYYSFELLPTDSRKYSRDGIRFGNVLYASPTASNLIRKNGEKLKIKYDIDDISRIFVLDPVSKSYLELGAVNPPVDQIIGMNRKMYNTILQHLRELGKITMSKIPGSRDILEAKRLLEERTKKKIKRNKKARKDAIKHGHTLTLGIPDNESSNIKKEPLTRLEILANKFNAEKEGKR